MYTPAWNAALNNGTRSAGSAPSGRPGVLAGNAATTKGKWEMAPLPQWDAGEAGDRQLGRLGDRR